MRLVVDRIFWALLLVLFAFTACSSGEKPESVPTLGAPAAPNLPGNWVVSSNFTVPPDALASMGTKLGAKLEGVRNTIYLVDGKQVQINMIRVADEAAGKDLMTALRKMKSEEAILQKGNIVYEFVGGNDVMPLIAEARGIIEKSN